MNDDVSILKESTLNKSLLYFGLAIGVVCSATANGQDAVVTSLYEEAISAESQPVELVGYHSEAIGKRLNKILQRPQGVFTLGAELPLLSLYANHGAGTSTYSWFDDFNVEPALRVNAAYQTTGILGFRGRFFDFGATGDRDPKEYVDIQTYDLDATTRLNLKGWDILAFGGLRWGSVGYSKHSWGTYYDYNFDGFGFSMGADVHRNIGYGFAFYGGVRQSMLYGESSGSSNFSPIATMNGVVVPVTELRIGTEYTHVLTGGSKLTLGAGFEHQQFSSLSSRSNGSIDPEDVDIALAGPVFSLTWQR